MEEERDWRVDWIRTHLIPLLDTRKSGKQETREEHLEEVEIALAQAYLEEGTGILARFAKVGVPLVLLDLSFAMSAQIYGLVFSMVGTWILLVGTDFQDRFSIAVQTKDTDSESNHNKDSMKKKRLARQSVMANIGLAWLTIGFIFQIASLILFPSGEAISTNLLAS